MNAVTARLLALECAIRRDEIQVVEVEYLNGTVLGGSMREEGYSSRGFPALALRLHQPVPTLREEVRLDLRKVRRAIVRRRTAVGAMEVRVE